MGTCLSSAAVVNFCVALDTSAAGKMFSALPCDFQEKGAVCCSGTALSKLRCLAVAMRCAMRANGEESCSPQQERSRKVLEWTVYSFPTVRIEQADGLAECVS